MVNISRCHNWQPTKRNDNERFINMRLVTIAEANAMDIGEKVPCIKGKILKVYDQTTGTNEHGAWSIQNVELVDPNDVKIKLRVKLFNQKPVEKSWQGRILYIESAQGEKGVKHVTMVEDTYKKKEGQPIKKQLEVKEEAVVGLSDGTTAPQQPTQPTQPAPQQTAAPQQQTPAQSPAPTTTTTQGQRPAGTKTAQELAEEHFTRDKKAVSDFRVDMFRAVNAFELIMDGVDYLAKRRAEKGKAMTPEQHQGCTTSIFIKMDRAGMVGSLPSGKIDKYLPPKPEEKAKE
jgi:hypothetical protein